MIHVKVVDRKVPALDFTIHAKLVGRKLPALNVMICEDPGVQRGTPLSQGRQPTKSNLMCEFRLEMEPTHADYSKRNIPQGDAW